jgi:hypothetical protein
MRSIRPERVFDGTPRAESGSPIWALYGVESFYGPVTRKLLAGMLFESGMLAVRDRQEISRTL